MMLTAKTIGQRLKKGSLAGAEGIAEEDANDMMVKDPLVIIPSIDPSEYEESGSASIDLRLGTWFVNLRQARMSHLEVDAPNQNIQFSKTHYVPFGESYYLHPRSFVLATTLEWLRLPQDIAAYVIGRSSWGRRGLIIATATGVHPGFKGCLTLEITNVGEIPIAIKPGMAICQLFFHEVKAISLGLTDRSQFAGSRKPSVGRIKPDKFFQTLTNNPQVSWILQQFGPRVLLKNSEGITFDEIKSDPLSILDEECRTYLNTLNNVSRWSVESQLLEMLERIAGIPEVSSPPLPQDSLVTEFGSGDSDDPT